MAMNPRLLVPRASYDQDAAKYLAAVEAADGQALETPVKRAIDTFFRDLKSASIFDDIKASCILCGARTLSGALVPLAGTAPTNNNFVAADYTRGGATPGLVGDGSTKYLNSNRANDDDPQDDFHMAVYLSETGTDVVMGNNATVSTGVSFIAMVAETSWPFRNRISVYNSSARGTRSLLGKTGFIGHARSSSVEVVARVDGTDEAISTSSTTPQSGDIGVLARINTQGSSVDAYSDARLAFYSIGESLDLEALDDAVSALVTAIGAAV